MDSIQSIDGIGNLKEFQDELVMINTFGCGAGKGGILLNADGERFVCH
jgi:hypothetical protein